MPHVIVKSWLGKTPEAKQALADGIVRLVQETLGVPQSSVSVGWEEIPREEWFEKAYRPDILEKDAALLVRPGYVPAEMSQNEEGKKENGPPGSK